MMGVRRNVFDGFQSVKKEVAYDGGEDETSKLWKRSISLSD
jgi:hypothetical protein